MDSRDRPVELPAVELTPKPSGRAVDTRHGGRVPSPRRVARLSVDPPPHHNSQHQPPTAPAPARPAPPLVFGPSGPSWRGRHRSARVRRASRTARLPPALCLNRPSESSSRANPAASRQPKRLWRRGQKVSTTTGHPASSPRRRSPVALGDCRRTRPLPGELSSISRAYRVTHQSDGRGDSRYGRPFDDCRSGERQSSPVDTIRYGT